MAEKREPGHVCLPLEQRGGPQGNPGTKRWCLLWFLGCLPNLPGEKLIVGFRLDYFYILDDSLRRRFTPVCTVLRKLVRFLTLNKFLIKKFQVVILRHIPYKHGNSPWWNHPPICKASSEENGTGQYPVWMTQKPRKGDFREWKSKNVLREHARTPLEACALGDSLGNLSVFTLDPSLQWRVHVTLD